jgi:mono/diheme cytochrome c family protein
MSQAGVGFFQACFFGLGPDNARSRSTVPYRTDQAINAGAAAPVSPLRGARMSFSGRMDGVQAWLGLGLLAVAAATAGASDAPAAAARVVYNRDVRPILAENCFACHGPDKAKRKGKLGLDTADDARKPLADGDGFAIVPGDPGASVLVKRILTADADDHMPPEKSGKHLSPAQIETLRRWIAQGAEYQPHWSYIPPGAAPAPQPATAADRQWCLDDIDRFIAARLAAEGLRPAPDADPATLIRRLSFDLTGLPPAPAEVDAFAADHSPQAYERLVDRLLASPHYGERMAMYWLDLVRYADSIGYHSDNPRNVSPYRDYVIAAFNADLPFDRFTIEQLAGDLLPEPTLQQRVASGYNRLLMTTEEGGAQPKEYEAKNSADRVRNVAVAWLGATMGCCECHDHKFDPFSTRDFYRLAAFFADIKEAPIGRREDGMPVPDAAQAKELARLDEAARPLQAILDTPTPELAAAQARWEAEAAKEAAWNPLEPRQATTGSGTQLAIQGDGTLLASKPADREVYTIRATTALRRLTGLRLEVLPDPSLPAKGPGTASNGNFVLSEVALAVADAGGEHAVRLTGATADFSQQDWPVANAIDGKAETGWAVLPQVGKPHHAVFTVDALDLPAGATLVATLTFASPHAQHLIGHLRLAATADAEPAKEQSLSKELREALALAPDKRSAKQKDALAAHYRSIAPALEDTRRALAPIAKARAELDARIARCLVATAAPPRTVRILARGNWQDESGEVVTPAVPHFLRQVAAADGQRATRLDLARWLVAEDNPLTARVFVNRMWKLLFGTGISKSVDDLGTQGEWPMHPELLDHLATSFRGGGWDVKALLKRLVMSHAYRLASTPPPDQRAVLAEKDPFDRLLSHQACFRLDAEMVRDNALAVSGLLVDRLGGPSVKPYQPAGYWQHLNFPERTWEHDRGPDAYRRGLYTWWQRTFMHPSLLAFDAPTREECVADRVRSNTPQQALVLLNDPTYVEAARAFAARILHEGGGDDGKRLAWAMRQALGRGAADAELAVLAGLLARQRTEYAADADAAGKLLTVGMALPPADLAKPELAAWTGVARAILNLHECITRY